MSLTGSSRHPLIHPRVRSAFREASSDCGVVRQIERAFEDEGLDPEPASAHDWYSPGQRRGTFDRYTASVDWSDARQVRRVLNVFEQILEWSPEGDYRENLVRHLQRDGYAVDDHGRIRGGSAAALAEIPLEQLSDPSSIYEHLERIAASTESDPGVAISGAKALVEATTKLVLSELQEPYDEKADVPALVKAAQKALALHPEALAPTKPGVEITKRILSNLSQLAIGVAELRNQYGPDHGRTTAVVGLRPDMPTSLSVPLRHTAECCSRHSEHVARRRDPCRRCRRLGRSRGTGPGKARRERPRTAPVFYCSGKEGR